jgi:hypothetical protein
MLELRKRMDRFPGFLLGQTQFVDALQVEPELGARAKEMG